MTPLESSCRTIRISCSGPSYHSIRDVTGAIRADPQASELGGGANLSEDAEFLRGVHVGTLGESHISHAKGGNAESVLHSDARFEFKSQSDKTGD